MTSLPVARAQFEANIQRSETMIGIAKGLEVTTSPVLDITDMYRASIVLGVSALDQFIHEIVRIGMCEIANGTRPPTDSFRKFKITLGLLTKIMSVSSGPQLSQSQINELDAEIRSHHGWQTFQQPDKIADAIRLISDKIIWDEVGAKLGESSANVKRQIALIVDRRNKIAHESDSDPTLPGSRWSINEGQSIDSVRKLRDVGLAIYDVVV